MRRINKMTLSALLIGAILSADRDARAQLGEAAVMIFQWAKESKQIADANAGHFKSKRWGHLTVGNASDQAVKVRIEASNCDGDASDDLQPGQTAVYTCEDDDDLFFNYYVAGLPAYSADPEHYIQIVNTDSGGIDVFDVTEDVQKEAKK